MGVCGGFQAVSIRVTTTLCMPTMTPEHSGACAVSLLFTAQAIISFHSRAWLTGYSMGLRKLGLQACLILIHRFSKPLVIGSPNGALFLWSDHCISIVGAENRHPFGQAWRRW